MNISRRGLLGLAAIILGAGGYYGWQKMTKVTPNFADIAYGENDRNVLDIYLPQGAGPHPFVMEIHGGAFKMGDKTAMPLQNEVLAAGIAIVRINYRFSSTDIWPAQGQDCLSAVAFLREHGADYGLDSARMALWGQSAGGFLAVSTAISLSEAGQPARGVVDFYGPMDFSTMDSDMAALGMVAAMGATNDIASPESQLLGYDVTMDPKAARAAGPVGRLETLRLALPAIMIRHGDKDDLVAHTQSDRLAKAWVQTDPTAVVDFALVPGAGHGTSEFNTAGVVTPLTTFLTNVLKLHP